MLGLEVNGAPNRDHLEALPSVRTPPPRALST